MGLPLDGVKPLIGNAFVDPDSTGEVVVDAVNRRGKQARDPRHLLPVPLG